MPGLSLADFNGTDSFSYTADDGNGGSDTAVVTITVDAIPDPPVANDQSETTAEDTMLLITLDAIDADGDSLNYNVTSGPTGGTLSNVGPTPTYTPTPDFSGADSFTYEVDDGNSGTDSDGTFE